MPDLKPKGRQKAGRSADSRQVSRQSADKRQAQVNRNHTEGRQKASDEKIHRRQTERLVTCGLVQGCQADAPVLPAAGTTVMPDTLPPSQVPELVSRHCQVTSLLSAMLRTNRAARREKLDSGAVELLIWV